jgi:hypothetical protein
MMSWKFRRHHESNGRNEAANDNLFACVMMIMINKAPVTRAAEAVIAAP